MKCWLSLLSVCIVSWSGLSCQQVKLKGGDSKSAQGGQTEGQGSDGNISKTDADERVDPPQNIIGHYLHCAVEKEPTEGKAEALVGCRLGPSEAQRVPATSLGSSYHYSSGTVPHPDVVAYAKDIPTDKRYDALFLFVGSTPQVVLDSARGTLIKVQIKDSKPSGRDVVVGNKLRDVERAPASFPEASTTDYTQARQDILNEAKQEGAAPLPNP